MRNQGLSLTTRCCPLDSGAPLLDPLCGLPVRGNNAGLSLTSLMYLAGIDIYDIMKVTGHTTPVILKKYIKASNLEVVEKLSDKYDYFD